MKRNDWILAVTVLIYSLLFYHQTPGINFLLFNLAILMSLVIRDSKLLKKSNWVIAALGSLLSAACVAIHGNLLTVIANLISLSVLSGLSYNSNSSVVLSLLFSAYSYLSSPVFMVMDYIDRKAKETMEKAGPSRKIILILLPVLVTVIFFFIYRSSNALFDALANKINLDFISWEWIMFTLLGTILLYGFYYYKRIDEIAVLDDNIAVNLSPVQKESSYFLGFSFSMSDENFSGILLFGLLNGLLLIVNLLDVNFMFGGHTLPLGVTYKEFVHQGVDMLIVSIIVAISIILFYFRGGLNFYKDNKAIKTLACLWVVQNAFMLFSTMFRNSMYISEYGLTYKRIGVYVYLLLTLIGLATTLIKVLRAKNNMYLFRRNGWIFYGLLIILSFPDWDRLVAIYNENYIKKPDTMYLLSLSNSALTDMLPSYTSSIMTKAAPSDSLWYKGYFRKEYSTRLCTLVQTHGASDWRSWYYDDTRLYNDITARDFVNKITVLDISPNEVKMDSLDMLNVFDHLTELHIHSLKPYSLKQLSSFKLLTNLDISYSVFSNISGLEALQNLQYLDVRNTLGVDYRYLFGLKNLKELDISNVTDDLYNEICRNMPNTVIKRV